MQIRTVKARKEVILAAGAVHSPQILQLSGIGPKGVMQDLGIEPQVYLPGVGQNFQDHPTIYPVFNFQSQPTSNLGMLSSNQTYAAEQLALYWAQRQGPYTIVNQGGNTVAFLPLAQITSDYQSIIDLASSHSVSSLYPDRYDSSVLAGYEAQRSTILRLYTSALTSVQETGWNGGAVMPITLVKPLSRGSIMINSTDVLTPPLIDFGALIDSTDLEILIAALRVNRAFIASSAMQELDPVELSPGANLTTDQELRKALRNDTADLFASVLYVCDDAEGVGRSGGSRFDSL
ncbi:hypothetical protein H2199_000876 [Coniosporium tulheliwenetii]|uniref:Uncharacterized protein n=1 Tax=Coniosporium tulheliwenetii TaxID=3383036 RepID=A0ACC2ZNJ8_9PEZI|nr:hypothetical protein H2199_000876 [Cladosporium sp. JES 115]